MGWWHILELAGATILIVIGALAMGWFKILKETNALLKEQNAELREQNDQLKTDNREWIEKHVENEKRIAQLQGQVDTLTKIPLNAINGNLSDIKKSNKSILDILKTSNIMVQTKGA